MKIRKLFQIFISLSVIGLLLFVFCYRLGTRALTSYDEAWYADIARNLLASKNPLSLVFNNSAFVDHPPLGFVLMAIPMGIFGISEFSVRFVSAISAIGVLILTYLIGLRIKNKWTGVSAALIVLSCLQFIYRARSGNLDMLFLFWECLTVYFCLKKGGFYFVLSWVSFACLFLTKTLVGLGVLPLLIFITFAQRKTIKPKTLLLSFLLALITVSPWYIYNFLTTNNFLYYHFVQIGMRGGTEPNIAKSIHENLLYLRYGIGRWYKPFFASIVFALISYIKITKDKKYWIILGLWFLGFSPLLLSSKTEIWHLLPLYIPIALIIAYSLREFTDLLFPKSKIIPFLLTLSFFSLASFQFYQIIPLIYSDKTVYSAEKDISIKAGNYSNVYLMDTFYPAAVFYSKHHIHPLYWDNDAYKIMLVLLSDSKSVIIVNNGTLGTLKGDHVLFKILDSNSDFYLISGN